MDRFFETLGWMSYVYATDAVVFLMVHGFVAITVIWVILDMRREAEALRQWPANFVESESTRALQEFVEECKSWGRSGVLVPMTDFADRLEAFVTSRADRLHSRVNLFLMSGVAGTFFAMFAFASKAGNIPREQIAGALQESLRLAFPVGFFGLLFTFIGHYVAFIWEERLRKAVNRATREAMRARHTGSSTIVEEITNALSPLKNLEVTLSQTLKPVIESFQGELKTATGLMQDQVKPLASAIEDFRKSAERLEQPASDLGRAANLMPEALGRVEGLMRDARTTMEGTVEAFRAVQQEMVAAAGRLGEAARQMEALPAQLTTEFAGGLASMREAARELWSASSAEFFQKIEPVCAELRTSAGELSSASGALAGVPSSIQSETGAAMRQIGESLTAALSPRLEELTAAASRLNDASGRISSAASDITAKFEEQTKSLADRSYKAWEETGNQFLEDTQTFVAQHWHAVQEAGEVAARNLTEAANGINIVSQQVNSILNTSLQTLYSNAMEETRKHLTVLDEAVALRYPKVLENLSQSVNLSADLATTVGALKDELQGAAGIFRGEAERWEQSARRLESLLNRPAPGLDPIRGELLGIAANIQGVTEFLTHRFGKDSLLEPLKKTFRRSGDIL